MLEKIVEKMMRNDPPNILKERFFLEAQAIHLELFHFFFETFDRKLQQFIEADLINFNIGNFFEVSNPKRFEEFKEPYDVLKLSELEAGFVVCTAPLFFSIFIFCIEWLPTLKDLVVTMFVFRKYFEAKKNHQSMKMIEKQCSVHRKVSVRLERVQEKERENACEEQMNDEKSEIDENSQT